MVSKAFYSAYIVMFLVSTYTSAKSWTSKSPLHSAVVAEERCQAKSSSSSKISDCVFISVSFLRNLLSEDFFYVFANNVERYTLLHEFFPLLYVRHLTFFLVFTNINFIVRLPPLVGRGPEFFQWFQNNTPFENSKILSTILSPVLTIVMLVV